ncbi:condensation domain-containing protein [Aquimarina sp. 2304DJ70-9]|uniref:condensation domain-containing protein n=1 Tax=Aquimarina penaris TaxID=3231044 RepID=UPI003461C2AA
MENKTSKIQGYNRLDYQISENNQAEFVSYVNDIEDGSNVNEPIFYGRNDDQSSYRGYRIEIKEIEKAIQRVNIYVVDSYVCIDQVHNNPILIAYLIANESFVNITTLSIKLKRYLPDYMIPTHFVIIDAISLLPNGRINVKKLPKPKFSDIEEVVKLPSTLEERKIAAIWKELLKLDEIDVNVSFFELGGHSLLANEFISTVRNKKGIDLSIQDFYKSPTIKGISKLVPSLKKKQNQKIVAPNLELYPLSYAQEAIWSLDQLDATHQFCYESRAIKLKGNVDHFLLEKTFSKLIEKHEILRTVFELIDGKPFQKILPPYTFSIPVINYLGLKKKDQKKVIIDCIENTKNPSFEIEKTPLFRVEMLKFSTKENVLIFCSHNMILDKWAQRILFKDFVDVYNELKRNPDFEIKKPKVSYKDYAFLEKENLNEAALNKRLDFWQDKLYNFSNELLVPVDNARPKKQIKTRKSIPHVLSLEFSEKLRQFSEMQNVSLFITMISAFKVMLSKYSSQTDICVGTSLINTFYQGHQEVLGATVNAIPLRNSFNYDHSLLEVLDHVKKTCLDAYACGDTPFEKIVEKVCPERSFNPQALFRYMFSFIDFPIKNMSLLDAEIEIIKGYNELSTFDINVVVNTTQEQADFSLVNQTDRRISLEWQYNSDIFKPVTMQYMLSIYLRTLNELITNPNQSLENTSVI